MNIKQRIRSSEFIVNTGTLIGGTSIAQVLPLVFAPVISRLFGPEDFSVYGVFIAIYSIAGSVITLRYDAAIMLPDCDKRAKNIVALCLTNAVVLSTLVFVLLLFFKTTVAELLSNPNHTSWLLLVPLAALLLAINNVLITWFNRTKKYKTISTNRIVRNALLTGSNVGLGALKTGHLGLISSQIISDGIASAYYLFIFYRDALLKEVRFRVKDLFIEAREYRNFPKFILPATFVDNLSAQMPILLIATLYSQALSGSYFFAWRILAIPVSIIGAAYAQTFYQKFVSSIHQLKYRDAQIFLKKSWILLASIILIPGIVVILWGVPLFTFLFGQEWSESGSIASVLMIFVLFAFVSSPTSTTYIALGMQKYNLYFSITVLTYRFSALYIGYLLNNFFLGIILLVVFEAMEIILYNAIAWRKLNNLIVSANNQ
jgi:lipopolysaccharide exporter